MNYMARLRAEAEKRPDNEPAKGAKGAFDGFDGSHSGRFQALPTEVLNGLAMLASGRAPRITRPELWSEFVADAVRLVDEGWAQQALALGWSPLHLWGCSPDKGGNIDHDGLAVTLAGRRIVLLDERAAVIESGAGSRRLFCRREMQGAVLLWDLGRVR